MNARLSARPAWSPKNLSRPLRVGLGQHRQEPPPEQAREHVDVHEEARPAGDPSRAVLRQPSTRHDHVHVRMMGESGAPGVEHRDDADARAQVLGVGRDRERGLSRGLHEQVVDHALVLIGDVAQLGRQRVDDMEIADGQQLRFALGEPLASPPHPDTWGNAGCGSCCRR